MDVDLKGTWVKDPETKVAGETVSAFQNLDGDTILMCFTTTIRMLWIARGYTTEGALLSRLVTAGFEYSNTPP